LVVWFSLDFGSFQ